MKLERYKVLMIILAVLVFAGTVFYVICVKNSGIVLEIRDTETGRVYGSWALEEPGEFSIEYIHSVNMSPVRETFVYEGKKIRLKSVRFHSFGAGMQSYTDEGQALTRDGDAFVITGFNVSFNKLNYISGTVFDHLVFDHLLIINDEIISLRDLAGINPDGKSAHITIQYRDNFVLRRR